MRRMVPVLCCVARPAFKRALAVKNALGSPGGQFRKTAIYPIGGARERLAGDA